ncbi:protein YafA [Escherichia coli]|nr:protein YafA [Escherichia coli]
MIWQPEFTDKTLSRKPGALQFSRIFNYYSVPEESRRVLSRQELLWLMSLTEDCPDMHQELLNCLLSGKKLTGLDKREIRSLWWEKMDAMQESATRQREQDTIRQSSEESKSE